MRAAVPARSGGPWVHPVRGSRGKRAARTNAAVYAAGRPLSSTVPNARSRESPLPRGAEEGSGENGRRRGGAGQRSKRVQSITAPHSSPGWLRMNSTGMDDEP